MIIRILIEKVFFFFSGENGDSFSAGGGYGFVSVGRFGRFGRSVGRSGQQRVYERKGWGFVKKPGPEKKEKKKKEKKKKKGGC